MSKRVPIDTVMLHVVDGFNIQNWKSAKECFLRGDIFEDRATGRKVTIEDYPSGTRICVKYYFGRRDCVLIVP